MRVIHLFL